MILEWYKFLVILATVFYLFSALQFYQLWKDFKKLKIGDEISKEFSDKSQKRIKVAIYLLVAGLILSLIEIFIMEAENTRDFNRGMNRLRSGI